MVVHCCIVKFTSFQHDGRRCYECMFACVKRNKKDSELLTCLLNFTEYLPDYLSAFSRTLLRFFGQPLSNQLYITYLAQRFWRLWFIAFLLGFSLPPFPPSSSQVFVTFCGRGLCYVSFLFFPLSFLSQCDGC